VHAVSPGGHATLYRLTYPDGPHDAEALLLDGSGTPFIITKNVLGSSGVYRPAGELSSPGPTPLERVGTLNLTATSTPGGPVGGVGSVLVTGAATTADGEVVAVRTYTDAYLYPVPDGDVVAALRREPVRVALPDAPQGEAIAFTPDGTLLAASEGDGNPVRALSGAAGLVPRPVNHSVQHTPARANPVGERGERGQQDGGGDETGVPTLPGIVIAVALAAALVFGLDKLRKR
jgi:hypothetical protein